MSKTFIPFAIVLLISAASSQASGKSWRGIAPLHSTAEDVARLSQSKACAETDTRCQFTMEEGDVMVVFSGSNIGRLACERVPKRTVLAVIVTFRSPKKLEPFKLKNRRFTVFDPSYPPNAGYKTYHYVRDGFMINAYNGQAIGLVYIAAEKDVHLCPEYYDDPKAFVEVGLIP